MTTTEVLPVTEEITIVDLVPYDDTDDGADHKTHIVNPPDNPHISAGFPDMEAQEVVNIARANGVEVVALCGYKWVPKRNPEKYDICSACMKMAEAIMSELGE